MLQRYSKNAVTDPEFNRRDYRQRARDGTSLEYRRTILYSEAMKTVNRGCSSDQMFDIVLRAFREVNSRMDDEENTTAQRSPSVEATEITSGQDEPPVAEDDDPYADILPPLVAKTKGSRAPEKETVTAKAPARPEPDLDEQGAPKGSRLCSVCHKIAGHNARTCLKRQLAQKLLKTHQEVYGNTTKTKNVKTCIKNLLAKQDIGRGGDEEELLDTDADDDDADSDDETDEDELEGQQSEEDETETTSGDDEDPGDDDFVMEEPEPTPHPQSAGNNKTGKAPELTPDPQPAPENSHGRPAASLGNINETQGLRECSICHKKVKHNARTCPDRFKVREQQLASLQTGGNNNMVPQGVRTCGTCGKIRGHNARTCLRLQLEERLRKQQEDLMKQEEERLAKEQAERKSTPNRHQKKRKRTVDTPPAEKPRRSSRLQ